MTMRDVLLPATDDRMLWDIWMSAFHFPALALADELGLFASLQHDPAGAEGVAERLSLSLGSAEALLGVMASLGLVQRQAGKFALTEAARAFLLEESPYSWGPALRVFRNIPATFDAMRAALQGSQQPPQEAGRQAADQAAPEADEHAMQQPGPGEARRHESPGEWQSPSAFTRAMHSLSFPAARVLAQRADFGNVRRFLDAGGGSGSYCIALALRYPDMRCTVMDMPEVCETTREFIREYGLEDRIEAVPGDIYAESWPAGYDVHFLSNVVHGQELDRCLRLAGSSFAALEPGGRLCIHEILLNDTKDGPPAAAGFSLAMRYFNGRGGQYTAPEIAGVLRQARFTDIRVTPTGGYYSLVTGTKA